MSSAEEREALALILLSGYALPSLELEAALKGLESKGFLVRREAYFLKAEMLDEARRLVRLKRVRLPKPGLPRWHPRLKPPKPTTILASAGASCVGLAVLGLSMGYTVAPGLLLLLAAAFLFLAWRGGEARWEAL